MEATAVLATTAPRGLSSAVSSYCRGWESPSLGSPRPSPPLPRDQENWPGAVAASLIAHWPSWWGAQTSLQGGPVKCGRDAVTPAGGPTRGSSHRPAQSHPPGRRLRALSHARGPGPGVTPRVLEPPWAAWRRLLPIPTALRRDPTHNSRCAAQLSPPARAPSLLSPRAPAIWKASESSLEPKGGLNSELSLPPKLVFLHEFPRTAGRG